jgi:hypothetical protein
MRIYGAISAILLGAIFGTCDRYVSAQDLLRGPAFAKEAAALREQAGAFHAKRKAPSRTPDRIGCHLQAEAKSAPAVRGAAQLHAPLRSGSPPVA